jgi:hypothetical protein
MGLFGLDLGVGDRLFKSCVRRTISGGFNKSRWQDAHGYSSLAEPKRSSGDYAEESNTELTWHVRYRQKKQMKS